METRYSALSTIAQNGPPSRRVKFPPPGWKTLSFGEGPGSSRRRCVALRGSYGVGSAAAPAAVPILGLRSGLQLLAQPVALAPDVDRDRVVEETVKDGGGDHGSPKTSPHAPRTVPSSLGGGG